jgi:hypothetical protein
MLEATNAANDLYHVEKCSAIGPTLAFSKADRLLFNHQTCYTDQILIPKLTAEEEAEEASSLILGKDVVICLSLNGMFNDYVSTWEQVAELDEDEDWYLEGKVIEVQLGQLKLETDEGESEWIPFKHIDVIELADGDEEPFEVYQE